MVSPHEFTLRYRRYVLAIGFALCLTAGAFVMLPRSGFVVDGPTISQILFFGLMSIAAYWVMRLFVAVAVKPFCVSHPRLVQTWALAWFYGAVPVTVAVTFLGLHKLHAPPPSFGMLVLCVTASAAMGIGAIDSIRVSRVV